MHFDKATIDRVKSAIPLTTLNPEKLDYSEKGQCIVEGCQHEDIPLAKLPEALARFLKAEYKDGLICKLHVIQMTATIADQISSRAAKNLVEPDRTNLCNCPLCTDAKIMSDAFKGIKTTEFKKGVSSFGL